MAVGGFVAAMPQRAATIPPMTDLFKQTFDLLAAAFGRLAELINVFLRRDSIVGPRRHTIAHYSATWSALFHETCCQAGGTG